MSQFGLWENASTHCAFPLVPRLVCAQQNIQIMGKCANDLCFRFVVFLTEEVPDEVVLEDLCCHGQKMLVPDDFESLSTKFSVNSSNHSSKSCNRSLGACVVSCSSRVNSLKLFS